ncbi:MAG: hypothetical protein HC860_24385 [Alkalinema sp. RU_4_3]|nr:hypothetical protein [Alkalinema sp. RU_4_3]
MEAKAIAAILNTQPLLRDQATKQAVLDRITQAPILHFATERSPNNWAGFMLIGSAD